jgi:hypothetical protein
MSSRDSRRWVAEHPPEIEVDVRESVRPPCVQDDKPPGLVLVAAVEQVDGCRSNRCGRVVTTERAAVEVVRMA